MGDMSPEFATKDEEIAFWKGLAQDLKIRLAESRDELDEFQENSRELEAELEAQLEQQEARVKELTARLARVQTENDQIKVACQGWWWVFPLLLLLLNDILWQS
ncbi:nuclear distribution protein nudE-like 1-A [Amphibalanus amphitrite]|nr:nuclear distribution protein nudE-like 1-A [Amphibalanus amphitrite]